MAQILALTKAQSLAYSYVRGAVARALGVNEALRTWQGLGGAIRRQDFLSLYRYASGIVSSGYQVQAVRHEYYPNYAALPDSLTQIRRQYSFDVRIGYTGEVDELGNPVGKYVTVTSDRKLRVKEILEASQDYVDLEEEQYQDIEYIEPVVVTGRKRGVL